LFFLVISSQVRGMSCSARIGVTGEAETTT